MLISSYCKIGGSIANWYGVKFNLLSAANLFDAGCLILAVV